MGRDTPGSIRSRDVRATFLLRFLHAIEGHHPKMADALIQAPGSIQEICATLSRHNQSSSRRTVRPSAWQWTRGKDTFTIHSRGTQKARLPPTVERLELWGIAGRNSGC